MNGRNSYAKCYDVKTMEKELENSAICTPFSVKALSLVCNLKSIIICDSIHSDSTRCVAVKVSSVVRYKLSWMENQSQKPNTLYEMLFRVLEINSEVLKLSPTGHDCTLANTFNVSGENVFKRFPRTGFHSQHDFSFIHFKIVCFPCFHQVSFCSNV